MMSAGGSSSLLYGKRGTFPRSLPCSRHRTGDAPGSSDDDVHQLSRDHDCPHDLLAFEHHGDTRVLYCTLERFVITHAVAYHDFAAHTSIDLHGNFDLLFLRQVLAIFRPPGLPDSARMAEHLPHLFRNMRG